LKAISLRNLLEEKKILLFDGSLGTELMTRGLKPGEVPDLWNIRHPKIIGELFHKYYTAGSDMVQTATFRANTVAMKGAGIEDIEQVRRVNRAAGTVLRDIRPQGRLVIGDIGPSGEFLPPVGQGSIEEMELGFRLQTQVLDPFVDAWHLETFSDLKELEAAVNAVKGESSKAIIASLTFRKTPKGFFTIMGNSLRQLMERMLEMKVDVIGSNCTMGSHEFINLSYSMRNELSEFGEPEFPLSIKPNAGQPELVNGVPTYNQTPKQFAAEIEQVLENNIQIIGGCCGTGPQHVEMLRSVIDVHLQKGE
jgi:5-methyltetrahydrofolate--homocysteine methyltransferase